MSLLLGMKRPGFSGGEVGFIFYLQYTLYQRVYCTLLQNTVVHKKFTYYQRDLVQKNFPYHPKKVVPLPPFRNQGGMAVSGSIGMLNQYRLNDFQSTPRPPKGGTPGLLARGSARVHTYIETRDARGGWSRGTTTSPLDRAPPARGVLRPSGCGPGGFWFVQRCATFTW